MAHHLSCLLETVSHFSYQLQPDASLILGPAGINPHNQRMDQTFRDSLAKALQATCVPAQACEAGQCSHAGDLQSDKAPSGSQKSGNAKQPAVGSDTWVLPTLQYGALGLRQDEACTVQLLVSLHMQHPSQ